MCDAKDSFAVLDGDRQTMTTTSNKPRAACLVIEDEAIAPLQIS